MLCVYRLVDEITFKLAEEAADAPTATAILGPFFRADTPYRNNGDNIVKDVPDGEMVFMHGRVIDFQTKEPLVGATVEVWQASTNGLYEQQDPNQEEFNLRGKFKTDADGRYYFYCLRPTPYPVPNDGTYWTPSLRVGATLTLSDVQVPPGNYSSSWTDTPFALHISTSS